MRFSILNTELNKGIQTVVRAVSNKSSITALTGIYMKATEDVLVLRGTDLEIGIECSVKANVEEPGVAVIPSKYFSDLVRKLPNTEINISKDDADNNLILRYFNSELSFNTFDKSQYSFLPEIDKYNKINLDSEILAEIIKQVSIAISTDESRPVFTGVYFETPDPNTLRLVSTDTHRLTLKDTVLDKKHEILPAIIPGKALQEISRIMDKDNKDIAISFGENQASFKTNNVEVKVRLIEGQFPTYQDVIPKEFSTVIKADTKLLMESVDRALLMSHADSQLSTNVIKLQLQGNTLVINSKSSNLGYVHEEIDVYKEGNDLEIAFNGRYLLDILKVVSDEEINIFLNSPLSPAIFKGENQPNYLYLVLPLRA